MTTTIHRTIRVTILYGGRLIIFTTTTRTNEIRVWVRSSLCAIQRTSSDIYQNAINVVTIVPMMLIKSLTCTNNNSVIPLCRIIELTCWYAYTMHMYICESLVVFRFNSRMTCTNVVTYLNLRPKT